MSGLENAALFALVACQRQMGDRHGIGGGHEGVLKQSTPRRYRSGVVTGAAIQFLKSDDQYDSILSTSESGSAT